MTDDLGRMAEAPGAGDGEGEPRSKGLLRHREPPEAIVDISRLIKGTRGLR